MVFSLALSLSFFSPLLRCAASCSHEVCSAANSLSIAQSCSLNDLSKRDREEAERERGKGLIDTRGCVSAVWSV